MTFPGCTAQHDSASVEKVTRRLPGVERSDVNLVAERMTIVMTKRR